MSTFMYRVCSNVFHNTPKTLQVFASVYDCCLGVLNPGLMVPVWQYAVRALYVSATGTRVWTQ